MHIVWMILLGLAAGIIAKFVFYLIYQPMRPSQAH